MVHILNRSGASAWAHPDQADPAFLDALWGLGVLVKEPTGNAPDQAVPPDPSPPAIISSNRIQVAAGFGQGGFREAAPPTFKELMDNIFD